MVRFLETVPRETEAAAPPTVGAVPGKPETGSFTGSTSRRGRDAEEAADVYAALSRVDQRFDR